MKRLAIYCLPLAAFAAHASAADTDLSTAIRAADGWVAWDVPLVADAGTPCCYAEWHGVHGSGQCDLDSKNWNIGRDDDTSRSPPTADTLRVYARVAHGTIERVRAFAASCALHGADAARRIDNVRAADSVALLQRVAQDSSARDRGEDAITALAMHADPAADTALIALSSAQQPREQRKHALFWTAQLRGADGAHRVERVAHDDPDTDLRVDAIFDLSQAHGIDAYASIHALAQHDAADKVREQALFWMAQMGDTRASADILAAIGSDASARVREQGVFALSQLKNDEGANALIALVRGDYPREVKKQALFWLGQSESDAAMKFLDAVLTEDGTAARK